MILEPKEVPTIVRVDRAFLEKYDPNRYGSKPRPMTQDKNAKLKAYLAEPRTTTQIQEALSLSPSEVQKKLRQIGARCVQRHSYKTPGVWIYEPGRTKKSTAEIG